MNVICSRLYFGTIEGCRAGIGAAAAGVLLASTRAFNLLPISVSSAALQGFALGIVPISLGMLAYYTGEYLQTCSNRASFDENYTLPNKEQSLDDYMVPDENGSDANYRELAKNLAGLTVMVISAGALGVFFGVNPVVSIALAIVGYLATGNLVFDAHKNSYQYEQWGIA